MTGIDTPMVRVLIVDDAARVRQDLRTVLGLAGGIEVVGEAAHGSEAVRLTGLLNPEVVLMDLEMPGLDGIEATRQIKARRPACRVIVLTVHGHESARAAAQAAGAEAFLVKGARVENIVRAITRQEE